MICYTQLVDFTSRTVPPKPLSAQPQRLQLESWRAPAFVALCPGIIETDISADIFDFAEARGLLGKLGHLNRLQRYGIPEEVSTSSS
ncbi:hypothetical protein FRB94_014072 [Tulasnella sp. JGI-2019a]|nr:hypothetical protein FRB93_011264 [Tulasnella sp. JGI-2019a]KAG8989727.1 hypothetical protein FRB94_014072 [Tulasnella sp. JGI-2019a]